ncbi:Uncharacterised protein [Vibrio cholerae]|nr:Uncharacterised protein [Vibrio cholerae]
MSNISRSTVIIPGFMDRFTLRQLRRRRRFRRDIRSRTYRRGFWRHHRAAPHFKAQIRHIIATEFHQQTIDVIEVLIAYPIQHKAVRGE